MGVYPNWQRKLAQTQFSEDSNSSTPTNKFDKIEIFCYNKYVQMAVNNI